MIAIRASFRARASFRTRARARARTRARASTLIARSVEIHSEVGQVLNEVSSTTACFRLRARAPFH
jgi:hypothetical protein